MEGSPLLPKHTSEMEYFTNSQYEDLSSGFVKETNMLTSGKIHRPSPICPPFMSAFTVELTEVVLPQLCTTIYLLSFALHSYTRLRAVRHQIQQIFEADYQGSFFRKDFHLVKGQLLSLRKACRCGKKSFHHVSISWP